MLGKNVNTFCKLCLHNENKSIEDLFNQYICTLSEKESERVACNFMLFIKAGEIIRESVKEIQTAVLKS